MKREKAEALVAEYDRATNEYDRARDRWLKSQKALVDALTTTEKDDGPTDD